MYEKWNHIGSTVGISTVLIYFEGAIIYLNLYAGILGNVHSIHS